MPIPRHRPVRPSLCVGLAATLAACLLAGSTHAQGRFGRPGGGMPNPGIGNPGMRNPGFNGNPGMGNPGFQQPGLGHPNTGFGPNPGGIGNPNLPGAGGGFQPPVVTTPVVEQVWKCSKCNAVVGTGPEKPKLSRCPHCGVRIGSGLGLWFGGGFSVLGVVVAIVVGIYLRTRG